MSDMTREEARTALGDRNNLLWGMSKEEQKYYSEALDMAISALQKNESAEEWYKLLYEKWNEGDWVCAFPKGTTNGEALNSVLRKVFPRIIFIRGVDEYHKTKSIVYSEEWENAPYKAESEEIC